MFEFLKKKNDVDIVSPVNGTMVSIENVSDPIFAKKLMGDGCAFKNYGECIYAPCDGKIMMIARTKHAIGIRCDNGAELLLHIGLDTVNLNGNGFEVLVEQNSRVKKNQLLMKLDLEVMKENDIDLTMPMILTNGSDYTLNIYSKDNVSPNDVVLNIKKLK